MSGRAWEWFACGEAAVVPIHGEIDIATADDVRDRLVAAGVRPGCSCVVADLSGVSFFDASGVRALMSAYRQLTRDGRHMVVAEPTPAAARTLDALAMHEVLDVYPMVDMALAHTQEARDRAVRRVPGTE